MKRIQSTPSMTLPRNGPSVHPAAGAGLWSTPADMLKFYKMLLFRGVGANGVRILKESTVVEILEKDQVPPTVRGEKPYRYSLGFQIDDEGLGWYGHGGAYLTNCRINPSRRQLRLVAQQVFDRRDGEVQPWMEAYKNVCKEYFGDDAVRGRGDDFVGRRHE